MGESLNVEARGSHRSGVECVRAVLAYHERKRARWLARVWFSSEKPKPSEPRRVRNTRGRLVKLVDRAGAGQTRRERLVSAAADYGANVYSTGHGTLDDLAYFLAKGLPVIVGYFDSDNPFDASLTGAQRVSANATHYAIVTGIENGNISLLLPHKTAAGENLAGMTASKTEFEKRWRLSDSMNEKERKEEKKKEALARPAQVDGQPVLAPEPSLKALADQDPQTEVPCWYMVLNFENERFQLAFQKGHDEAPPLLDLRRKRRVLALVWALFVTEVFLGISAYADPSSYVFALLSLGFAVFGFTAIDYFARPEQREYTGTLVPRWYRRHLPFWCLVPFLTALGGSIWVHYQKWNEARVDIHQLAREIKVAVERDEPPPPESAKAVTVVDNKQPEPTKDSEPKAADPASPTQTNPKPNTKTPDPKTPEPKTPDTNPAKVTRDVAVETCITNARTTNKLAIEVLVGRRPPTPTTPVIGEPTEHVITRAWVIAALAEWTEAREGLQRQSEIRIWECFTTERIHDRVALLLANRYHNPASDEAIRFGQIARVVGHDVMLARGYVDEICKRAQHDTASSFALSLGVQALFILWIPALLAVTIARARKRTSREHLQDDVANSMNLRDHAILAEDQYLFVPRLCFAILLVLGTNYVFAPLGLKSTYIMSLVDEHALPGHTTFTLWITAFSSAPVIVVGFVGFLLYALITATQRFAQDDFDDRSLLALLVRGLVVILLSFALSSSEMNEFASRTFVFIAGVFPIRALEAIAKKVNVTIDPDFSTTNSESSFVGLPGLDPVKVFALRTAGIQSTYDLAAMNINDVAERVRIDPRLLGRSVDRAILIDAIGATLADRLGGFGITSATELVKVVDLAKVILPTEAADQNLLIAATLSAARLKDDARVESVRRWQARK